FGPRAGRRRDDEPLVDELLERRVDRAGARPPGAFAAGEDALDEPVAVARVLGEQRQDRAAHVALAGASAEAARAEARAAEEAHVVGAGAAGHTEAGAAVVAAHRSGVLVSHAVHGVSVSVLPDPGAGSKSDRYFTTHSDISQ